MRVPSAAVSRPYIYPLIVSIVALFGLYYVQSSDFIFQNLENLLAGVVTATFASYLTIILVDSTFREQEKERRQKMQNAAFAQLQIDRYLGFLVKMYIVSSIESPNLTPSSYDELFNGDFNTTIQLLDFSEEFPTARESRTVLWFDYSESQLKEFQNSIDQVISQYGAWLDPGTVKKLQRIQSSTFMGMIISTAEGNIIQLDEEMGYDREYAMLHGHEDIIEDHTDALLDLLDEYQQTDEVNIIDVEDLNAWNENISPGLGSARLTVESTTTANQEV